MHFWRHIHIKHLLYGFICKSIITFSNRFRIIIFICYLNI
nr:MAG TPA: hypothetical protein [Caudoviricetes sp.]